MQKINNKKFILGSFFLFFLISSCTHRKSDTDAGCAAIFSYSKEMEKSQGWTLAGYGGSFYNQISALSLSFTVNQRVDIEHGRRLFIKGLEGFLDKINRDKTLRSSLHHFPFTFKDIEFDLDFLDNRGRFFMGDCLAYISIIDGKICYKTNDPQNGKMISVLNEDYVDALKIVRSENSN
jgi:hypothetical protein